MMIYFIIIKTQELISKIFRLKIVISQNQQKPFPEKLPILPNLKKIIITKINKKQSENQILKSYKIKIPLKISKFLIEKLFNKK